LKEIIALLGRVYMWGWRVFAIFVAAASIWSIFDAKSYNTWLQILDLPISSVAAIGLIFFAFNIRALSNSFWRAVATFYIAYSILVIVLSAQILVSQHADGTKSIWIYVASFAVVLALQVFIALGLWRYSARLQATSNLQSRAA
jgi:hypothetical protein